MFFFQDICPEKNVFCYRFFFVISFFFKKNSKKTFF